MNARLLAVFSLALMLPVIARAQGEAKPASVDPIGKYAVQAVVQGQAADFELVVEQRNDGTYTGTLANPSYGTSTISSLKIEGRTIKLVLATPQGVEAVAEYTLGDDGSIDGSWSMQGDGGKMTGKRVR